MDLVIDHVLQALIVGRPNEDLGGHFTSGEAVVDDLRKQVAVKQQPKRLPVLKNNRRGCKKTPVQINFPTERTDRAIFRPITATWLQRSQRPTEEEDGNQQSNVN